MTDHARAPAHGSNRFGRALLDEFLLDPALTHFNHGAFGAVPRAVARAAQRYRREMERDPTHFMETRFRPLLRRAAEALAKLTGADADGIACVENATQGVNAVLRGLDFKAGDEIVITSHTYNAVRNAARYVAGRADARVIEVPLPPPITEASRVVETISAAFGPKTRLVILDHVTSPSAVVLPVVELVARAKAAGALVLVDGAHAPGMIPIDVPALGAEWYTGNCHKWLLAPRGAGFLWSAPEVRACTHPLVISHGFKGGYAEEFDRIGTRDAAAQHAVPAALRYRERLGGEAVIRAYNHDLALAASRLLIDHVGCEPATSEDFVGAMRTLALPRRFGAGEERARELHARLRAEHAIQIPVRFWGGRLWLRLSAQIYNELEDFARLAEALEAP